MSQNDQRIAEKLLRLGDQISRSHFKLSAVVDTIYSESLSASRGVSPSAMRGVLRDAAAEQLRTVPEIAALRPVSRQYVQKVVNALVAAGLAELLENPRHKRSKLVAPTKSGLTLLDEFTKRERPILLHAAKTVGADEVQIEAALDLLERLSSHMDKLLAPTSVPEENGR